MSINKSTIVITAGMDGDEYAGIEAAYELKEEFDGQPHISIIPIVNIPGFEGGQSKNPLDLKFLKHIFPGKQNGSSSEQIMHRLYEGYLKGAQLWIDLHGGSVTEELIPYIYSSETGSEGVNKRVQSLFGLIPSRKIIVYTKKGSNYFIETVAKKGIAYIRLEAGQKGQRNRKWINLHKKWVKKIIETYFFICHPELVSGSHKMAKSQPFGRDPAEAGQVLHDNKIYTKTTEYKCFRSGLWYPFFPVGSRVLKHHRIGEIYSFEKKLLQMISAQEGGVLLWQKCCLSVRKNDILCEIASD